MWTSRVEEPFRDDPEFWSSVGNSADAFWALVIATVVTMAFGVWAVLTFCVPVVLLVMSARDARASTERTRPLFASRDEWRAAERQAVAAAIPGALVRHLRR